MRSGLGMPPTTPRRRGISIGALAGRKNEEWMVVLKYLAGTLHASRSDYLITGMVYDNAPTFPLFPLKFAWHMRHFSETTGMPVATRR
jgi:hypothetical protein